MLKQKKVSVALVAAIFGALAVASTSSAAVTARPTTAQKQQLQFLIEEEKMSRDVYTYLAKNVTSQKFANIARSEQTHMDNVAVILKKYNFFNPTTSRAPGVYRDKEIQAMYDKFIAQGSASVLEAFAVGVAIEEHDIADLQKFLKVANMPADMRSMMELLLRGSYNHLKAFSN